MISLASHGLVHGPLWLILTLASLCGLAGWPFEASAHPGHVRPGGLYVAFKVEAQRVRGGLNLPADQLARATGLNVGAQGEDEVQVAEALPDEATLLRLRDRLRALPAELAPVHVDGVLVVPEVERVDLLLQVPPPTLMNAPSVPGLHLSPSPFPAAQVRFSLPIKAPPRRIEVRWTRPDWLATPAADAPEGGLDAAVAGTVLVDGTDTPFHLTANEPHFAWHAQVEVQAPMLDLSLVAQTPRPSSRRWPVWLFALGLLALGILVGFRRRPVLALAGLAACAGGAFALRDTDRFGVSFAFLENDQRPSELQARRLFEARLRTVYGAFEASGVVHEASSTPATSATPVAKDLALKGLLGAQDAAAYDALAQAVDGPLLDWMYRQVFETLVQRENGGAIARLEGLEVLSAEVRDPPPGADPSAFGIHARWRVIGEVRHFDHAHRRAFELTGDAVLAPRPAGLRIVALQVTEQTRIDTEVPLGLLDAR